MKKIISIFAVLFMALSSISFAETQPLGLMTQDEAQIINEAQEIYGDLFNFLEPFPIKMSDDKTLSIKALSKIKTADAYGIFTVNQGYFVYKIEKAQVTKFTYDYTKKEYVQSTVKVFAKGSPTLSKDGKTLSFKYVDSNFLVGLDVRKDTSGNIWLNESSNKAKGIDFGGFPEYLKAKKVTSLKDSQLALSKSTKQKSYDVLLAKFKSLEIKTNALVKREMDNALKTSNNQYTFASEQSEDGTYLPSTSTMSLKGNIFSIQSTNPKYLSGDFEIQSMKINANMNPADPDNMLAYMQYSYECKDKKGNTVRIRYIITDGTFGVDVSYNSYSTNMSTFSPEFYTN